MGSVIDFTSRQAVRRPRVDAGQEREARIAELARTVVEQVLDQGTILRRLHDLVTAGAPNAASATADEPIWRPAAKPLPSSVLTELKMQWMARYELVAAAKAAFEAARHLVWAEHHAGTRRMGASNPTVDLARDAYSAAAWRLMRTAPFDADGLRWKMRHVDSFDDRKQEVADIIAADERWLELRSGANRRARAAAGLARRKS
ncbi:MAG: hypothetical protein WAS21_09260 [Geminicoccaceae bacterium]